MRQRAFENRCGVLARFSAIFCRYFGISAAEFAIASFGEATLVSVRLETGVLRAGKRFRTEIRHCFF